MSVEQIQENTKLTVVPAGPTSVGTHAVWRKSHGVMLTLVDGALESYVVCKRRFMVNVDLSARRNVCTGQESFLLHFNLPAELSGADWYVDGSPVEFVEPMEVPVGTHELRIEKRGYEPIVKQLRFDPGGPGRKLLDLIGEAVQVKQFSETNTAE